MVQTSTTVTFQKNQNQTRPKTLISIRNNHRPLCMKPVTDSHMESTTCRISIHLAPSEMYSMRIIFHADAFAEAFRIQHGTTLQSVASGAT